MIGLNAFQIFLVSVIILLTSSIVQEYSDEMFSQLQQKLPLLFSSKQGSDVPLHMDEKIPAILRAYESILTSPKPQKNIDLAFGYVADIDIYVDAVELMHELGIASSPPTSIFHESISDITSLSETLALFFEKGAGGEFFVTSKDFFNSLVRISKKISKKSSLGGNAATMAVRAAKEGANVILGHAMSKTYFAEFFNAASTQLIEEITDTINDIHLVLDFYADIPWGDAATPRSNRLYLNHDIENSQLSYSEKLHTFLKTNDTRKRRAGRTGILGIGGFQLLSQRNRSEVEQIMTKLGRELVEIKAYGYKIHAEMATFTDKSLFKDLLLNVFLNADSIGLNEQELQNLLSFLNTGSLIEAGKSEMDYNTAIMEVLAMLQTFQSLQIKVNRVHFHTINLQMMCGDSLHWEDSSTRWAIVKSLIIALQESEGQQSSYFAFDPTKLRIDVPDEIILPKFQSDFTTAEQSIRVKFDPRNPVHCWNPFIHTHCCVAPVIQIIHPKKTCGLGDNISATGLVYHTLKEE